MPTLLFHTVDESTNGIQLLCCNLVDRRQQPLHTAPGLCRCTYCRAYVRLLPTRSQLYKIWRGSRCMAFPKMLTTTQLLLSDSSLKSVSSSFSSSSFSSHSSNALSFSSAIVGCCSELERPLSTATVSVNYLDCTVTRVIHICAGSASRATLAAA